MNHSRSPGANMAPGGNTGATAPDNKNTSRFLAKEIATGALRSLGHVMVLTVIEVVNHCIG